MDYTSLPILTPTEDASASDSISVSHFVRQNPWSSKINSTATILRDGIIHAPHAHTYEDYSQFKNNSQTYKSFCESEPRQFIDIPTGSNLFIPSADRHQWPGLLVRVTGEAFADACPNIIAVHTLRECNHQMHTKNCITCKATGIIAMDSSQLEDATKLVLKGTHFIEPFWAIQRKVEILGIAKTDNFDKRQFATPASIAKVSSRWVPVK